MSSGGELQRPHPNTCKCADCGHVWFAGERRHQYVDAAGDVSEQDGADALCILCIDKRRRGAPPDDGDGVRFW